MAIVGQGLALALFLVSGWISMSRDRRIRGASFFLIILTAKLLYAGFLVLAAPFLPGHNFLVLGFGSLLRFLVLETDYLTDH